MRGKILKLSAGIGLLIASTLTAQAMPAAKFAAGPATASGEIIPIAQGCGPGGWRGPWGGCRHTPYVGPLPGGGWVAPPAWGYYGNGCPPGYWRGPWGHCRNTPYHGRLPNGGWQ
jgi:hypothetical protein